MRHVLRIASMSLMLAASSVALAQEVSLSSGQAIYLPVYSRLYHGEIQPKTGKPSMTLVSTHVSVRNTDPKERIRLASARYYNTEGKLLRDYLQSPQIIPPLGTYELFVSRTDSSGGPGANFIIDWSAEKPVNSPLVEALHADIREARTLLFTTTGRPLPTR